MISVMDKGTDNGDEEDDWHVEYIDPSHEETVFFLSSASPNRCRNDERTNVNEETRGEAEDYVHGQQRIDNDDIGVSDEDTESPRRRVRCCKPKIYVSLASAMAALGGVLFGYDTGIISGAILQLKDEFSLSCPQTEIVISVLMVGAVAASFCGGFLVDWLGRRATIIANDVVFLVGTIILTSANSYGTLIVGRLVVGFAVSLSATAECVYITEISPASRRGLLVSLNELGITLGFLLAYLFNFIFIGVEGGWRYMFVVGAALAIVQGVGMYFLPMSPRYLIIKGQLQKARLVLWSLFEGEDAEEEFERIKTSVADEKNLKMSEFCCGGRSNIWPALFISMMLVFLQQISGQPSVLLYAPMIFREVGLQTNAASVLATVGLGLSKFLVTLVYLLMIDGIGRRRLLMLGAAAMMLSVFVLAILIRILFPDSHIASSCSGIDSSFPNNSAITTLTDSSLHAMTLAQGSTVAGIGFEIVSSSSSIPSPPSDYKLTSSAATWVALIAVFFYVAGYSIGFGPGTWLVMSEIFPSSIKGRAIAFATTLNWGMQLVTSITFLDVIVAVGSSWLFVGYGCVCAVSIVFIYCFVPETKGKSLEVIASELRQPYSQNRCCCCCCGRRCCGRRCSSSSPYRDR